MRQKGHRHGRPASPCAGCKLLRRKCVKDCVFAPYFPSKEPYKFAIVHKIFGASNVNKMLQELSENQQGDAVNSMVYEANARVQDPVYGCVGTISSLQRQLEALQTQLAFAQAELIHMRTSTLCRIDIKPSPYTPSTVTFPTNKDFSSDVDMAFVYEDGSGDSLWSC
ncbi:PREDICTED: LOB domain-containing protein 3-like isoform X2 [Camelina sativa]|uniref:LOB domain-containing protein 3-like isoform X2 n=1 Tax=Camelina sativa TaxID=90675 RepID=A0ABM0YA30_CAMSA|nr:PREDICTED: LOB domain-containing protein 3-like isoform X2 [Camelina sativa]